MADSLTLLRATSTGIPGRQRTTYTADRPLTGSIAPMSLASYTRQYSNGAYVDNGTYSLATVEVLPIGAVVEYRGRKLKVIGFLEGRVRNHAHLQVIPNE